MQFKIGKPFGHECAIENANRIVINYNIVHVIGLFLGLGIAFFVYMAWRIFFPNLPVFAIYDAGPAMFLGSLAIIAALHEIFHLITHPGFGFSNQSVLGIEPKSGLPYAAYNGVMTRIRLVAILFAPFFMLTILPFLIAYFKIMPDFTYLFSWCSLFNTSLAGIDIYTIFFILKNIPPHDFIHGEFHGKTLKSTPTTQTLQN